LNTLSHSLCKQRCRYIYTTRGHTTDYVTVALEGKLNNAEKKIHTLATFEFLNHIFTLPRYINY
jgi:hypothetical protein